MPTQLSRDVLFVSHANPEDNDFARWLTLKLVSLGYHAWSDVTRLLGGEDFWRDIEQAIRQHTVKVLYVLSRSSNDKEGTLRELKVAHDVRKKESFSDFVIPLHIDDLPFGDFNIQLASLNAIDFSLGWAPGLKQLVAKLEKDRVPKNAAFGPDAVRAWWTNAFNVEQGTANGSETHTSNWFRIQLPETIYKHTLIGLLSEKEPEFPFPATFRNAIITFAPAADVERHAGGLKVQATVPIKTSDYLNDSDFKVQREQRDIVVGFINQAWQLAISKRLEAYQMSGGRIAFHFDTTSLPEPEVKFTGVTGKASRRALMGYKTTARGKRHWHFALSAKAALHPEPVMMLRTHVLFSDDGMQLWESSSAMHRARRTQCKSWWNDDWRDRLLASMAWIADGDAEFALPLGDTVHATVSARPVEFLSPIALNEQALDEGPVEDAVYDDDDDSEDDDELEGAS